MEYIEAPWGQIPANWQLSKIKDETTIVTDYVANGSFASLAEHVQYKKDEDYAVLIRLADYTNNFNKDFVFIDENAYNFLSKSKLYGGEIIISNVGAVGVVFRCPYLKYKMSLAPNSIMVKFKGDNDFYFYWLKSRFGQHMLHSIVTGSAQPKFNKTNFKDMVVPVPPIEVQRRIGELLKSFDDKIENNNRINRNLEAQAQALFKSWFVDFEPWGGTMPEDWKEYQLSELADVVGGYSYKGSELMPSEDAMATIKNFDRKGYFKLDGYKEIQISGRFKNTQILNLFDVVVAHTDITQQADIIGNPAIILSKGGYRNIIMSMDLCKVQPTHYAISSAFLYCLLKDIRFKSHALGYVNGTTVLHMSKKALPEYRVFLPNDLSKVQELGDRLQNLYKRYSINLEESQRLAALRDTLLPKLMKGEIAL